MSYEVRGKKLFKGASFIAVIEHVKGSYHHQNLAGKP